MDGNIPKHPTQVGAIALDNGQFNSLVTLATREVQEHGLQASAQAVMLFGLGHLDRKLNTRVLRLDGKLMISLGTSVGVAIGFAIKVVIT